MSKSAGEKHYINVFADETTLRRQIKSAVTDTGTPEPGVMSDGVQNLFELIKASGNQDDYERLLTSYHHGNLKYVDLKEVTADSLWNMIAPFREKKISLESDKKLIKEQIKDSSASIRKIAQETMREVKELAGLMNAK
jgi:tryptophanyl-tRNA synthetase